MHWGRGGTRKQQTPKLLSVLVFANQFAHVFAVGAVATLRHLAVDKRFERVGQRNVHGGHEGSLAILANFGKKKPLKGGLY
jgi:hypothetical protein